MFNNELRMLNNELSQSQLGQCNILLIGKTGVGKSTLINEFFEKHLAEASAGKPVTQAIQQYTKPGCPVTVYDSRGLEVLMGSLFDQLLSVLFDSNKQTKKDVSKLIDDQKNLAPKEHIHIIWYCINQESGRLEDAEQNWIKELEAKGVPVIIVLTKSIQESSELKEKLESEKKGGKLPVRDIIPVLAK